METSKFSIGIKYENWYISLWILNRSNIFVYLNMLPVSTFIPTKTHLVTFFHCFHLIYCLRYHRNITVHWCQSTLNFGEFMECNQAPHFTRTLQSGSQKVAILLQNLTCYRFIRVFFFHVYSFKEIVYFRGRRPTCHNIYGDPYPQRHLGDS